MAGSVIERHGHEVDGGWIEYDDRKIGWAEADKKAGFRLDRRKSWAFVDNEVCEAVSYTSVCSGCSYDYGEEGAGCDECGHHGVRRSSMWIPFRYSHPTTQ